MQDELWSVPAGSGMELRSIAAIIIDFTIMTVLAVRRKSAVYVISNVSLTTRRELDITTMHINESPETVITERIS